MEGTFQRKYKKVLEILPDVAECANGNLILVGGTALALFYLKHRASIDLDFVPIAGDEAKHKENLKGRLSKMGYRTATGVYQNQFIVQFEDTSIKIEIFYPDYKIQKFEEHVFGTKTLKVASLDDIFQMKIQAYNDRMEARDIFDIFCILKLKGSDYSQIKKLILKAGMPNNIEDIDAMAINPKDAEDFKKAISYASA